jgi:hypothetical protein
VKKNCNERKNGKGILGLMTDEEEGAFFGEGCCENAQVPSGKEKEDWRDFSKVECCSAQVRFFFIPSQFPVSQNGLMHTC